MTRDDIQDAFAAARQATRTYVAEPLADGEWLCMHPDGSVKPYLSAAAVVAAVRQRDKSRLERSKGVVLSRIEWRNTPAGFVPPE